MSKQMEKLEKLSKKERLEKICSELFNGNMSAMGRVLGIRPQSIKSWFDRETYKPCEIYEKLPQLSAEWLLTGEGEMLKGKTDVSTAKCMASGTFEIKDGKIIINCNDDSDSDLYEVNGDKEQ